MNMKVFIAELPHWIWVGVMLFYLINFYLRWHQTYKVSHGHYVVGLVAVAITLLALVVVMGWFEWKAGFLVLNLIASSIWLTFNNWYFYKYPVPNELLKNLDQTEAVGKNTRIGQFLTARQEDTPAVFGPRFYVIGTVLLLLLTLGFGFVRAVNIIAESDRRSKADVALVKHQADSASAALRQQLTTGFRQVTDTLQQGQEVIKQLADNNHASVTALTGVVKSVAVATGRLNRKVDQTGAAVERTRRGIVVPGTIKPLPPKLPAITTPASTTTNTGRKGRNRYGYESGPNPDEPAQADTSTYAQNHY